MSDDVNFEDGNNESLMVDLTNVEEPSFEVMPRGTYPVVFTDVEFTYSQNSGNPMWSCTLEVEDGEYAGRKLFTHMVFAGNGLGFTKKQLGRIKPELLQGPFDPQDPEVIESLLGIRARVRVSIRKYEGTDRNNVADVFASDGGDSFTG